MKNSANIISKVIFLIGSFVFISGTFSVFGAPQITLSIGNCSVGANFIQFECFAQNTSTAGEQLWFQSFTIRETHAAAILPGGTNYDTAYYVGGGNPAIALLFGNGNGMSTVYTPGTRLIQTTTSTIKYGNANSPSNAPWPNGTTWSLGIYRLVDTTQDFVPNTAVALAYLTASGVNAYITATAPAATALNGPSTRIFGATCNPGLITPAACQVSIDTSNIAGNDCYDQTDGSVLITLSGPSGVTSSGTYTIDGGTILNYSSNPFTVYGLGSGTHSITVTTANPNNNCMVTTPVFIITGPLSPLSTTSNITACDSYTWAIHGTTYTSSGTFVQTSLNSFGCLVTDTLNLVVNNSSSHTTNISTCDNSYTWSDPLGNGNTYTSSTTVTNTTLNAAKCVHTETLVLVVGSSTSHTTTVTACESYTWPAPLGTGLTYTASATITNTSLNAAGCVHTETLMLTINSSSSHITNVTACNSYTWAAPPGNGNTYTSSVTVTSTSLNAAGCVHTETLVLTVNYSTSHTNNISTCNNSYTWPGPLGNGNTYTSSTTVTNTTLNATGCVHTETLVLVFGSSTSHTTTVTACDSYTWPAPLGTGLTYTASATITNTSLNAAGCVHTETLALTVNYSTSSSSTITACDSYTWAVNGTSYTNSGTYTSTALNASGCVFTRTLLLTINRTSSSSSSATACGSYTWSANNVTYTSSGTYTFTSLNTSNCTNTATLVLTIKPVPLAPVASAVNNCNNTSILTASGYSGTLLWSSGQTSSTITVSAGGIYTVTQTVNGCTSPAGSATAAPKTTPSAPGINSGDNCNGTAALTATGLASGAMVLWSNGTTATSFTAGPGSYTVTQILNGCSSSSSASSTVSTQLSASSSGSIACNGGTATVIVSATGGTTPYSGTGTFTLQGSDVHNYTVTDAHGCTKVTSVTLVNPPAIVVTAVQASPIICFGGTTCVNVSATGGTGALTGTGSQCGYSAPGPYTFTVTDSKGCSANSNPIALTAPAAVGGTVTTTPSGCSGNTGTATVVPTGGSGVYTTYAWSPAPGGGQGTQTATGLSGGTSYSCLITDNTGCSGTSSTGTVGSLGGIPPTPGPISGPAGACRNQSGVVYCVPAVSGYTYSWVLPQYATGSSTSNCIAVAFGANYNGGTIQVSAVTALCGSSGYAQINVPYIHDKPADPQSITGPASICSFPSAVTYSTPLAQKATSYLWTVTGTGLTIASGQGTNTVTVNAVAGFTGGSVNVVAVNCVNQSDHSISIPVTGPLQALSSVCTGCDPNNTNVLFVCSGHNYNYQVAVLSGATSYTWTAPAGSIINDGHGTGNPKISTSFDNQWDKVQITFPSNFVSGNVTVTGNNSCSSTAPLTFAVATLQAPASITGPSSPCVSNAAGYTCCAVAQPVTIYQYHWQFSDGWVHVIGQNNVQCETLNFTGIQANHNPVTVSVRLEGNGCQTSYTNRVITVNLGCRSMDPNTSNASAGLSGLNAYPNPTSGKLSVTFMAAGQEKYILRITDLVGHVISSDANTAVEGENSQELDLGGVAKGMYFLSIEKEDDETQTMRIAVE